LQVIKVAARGIAREWQVKLLRYDRKQAPISHTGGPTGCSSRPCARAKPLAERYITHSKFKRAKFPEGFTRITNNNQKRIRQRL
jgi:hypothetical protein